MIASRHPWQHGVLHWKARTRRMGSTDWLIGDLDVDLGALDKWLQRGRRQVDEVLTPTSRNWWPFAAQNQAVEAVDLHRFGASDSSLVVRPSGTSRRQHAGWQPSRWLEWDDVKQIDHVVHRLVELGRAPTHHITIMPLSGDERERKRRCYRHIGHIGQALHRRGFAHIGITVFEHEPGRDLHAHHLIHVPRTELKTIQRRHRPPEIDVQAIYEIRGLLEYVTKERRPLPPDFEKEINRRRVPCLPILGKRWSMTKAVKELLAADRDKAG